MWLDSVILYFSFTLMIIYAACFTGYINARWCVVEFDNGLFGLRRFGVVTIVEYADVTPSHTMTWRSGSAIEQFAQTTDLAYLVKLAQELNKSKKFYTNPIHDYFADSKSLNETEIAVRMLQS